MARQDNSRRDLIAAARRLGWEATLTNGGHLRLTHPRVPKPIFAAQSPGDWRAHRNTIALMRRMLRT